MYHKFIYLLVFLYIIGTRDPECYVMKKGEDYRGNKSVAVDGSTCLSWTIRKSYLFEYNPMDYPDAGLGGHNECRNPDSLYKPWCYYSTQGDWEHCNIHKGCDLYNGMLMLDDIAIISIKSIQKSDNFSLHPFKRVTIFHFIKVDNKLYNFMQPWVYNI